MTAYARKVLWVGQEETNLGSDLISQTLTFKDQVDNFSQKSSMIKSSYEIGIYILHSPFLVIHA